MNGWFCFSVMILILISCSMYCHPITHNDVTEATNLNNTNISYMCEQFNIVDDKQNYETEKINNYTEEYLDRVRRGLK